MKKNFSASKRGATRNPAKTHTFPQKKAIYMSTMCWECSRNVEKDAIVIVNPTTGYTKCAGYCGGGN